MSSSLFDITYCEICQRVAQHGQTLGTHKCIYGFVVSHPQLNYRKFQEWFMETGIVTLKGHGLKVPTYTKVSKYTYIEVAREQLMRQSNVR